MGDLTVNRQRLRALRIMLGWSPYELARQSGMSRSCIRSIESEGMTPRPSTAIAIAKALGVPFEEIFTIKEE